MFRIEPFDGWGFAETIDGKLADPFDAEVTESEVDFGPNVVGWKARALNGKYAGCYLELTPRHVERTDVIVLWVFPDQHDRNYLYSGMADTTGLECNWK